MKTHKIEDHIDKKIFNHLSNGESYSFVIKELQESIEKFKNRNGFIGVSKKYLLLNWDVIIFKKRYTTYYVMYSTKRLHDLEWIIKKQEKFPTLQRTKMFGLVQLRDKLSSISL